MSYRHTNNLIKGLGGFQEIKKSLMRGGSVRFIGPPVKGDGAVVKYCSSFISSSVAAIALMDGLTLDDPRAQPRVRQTNKP